MVSIEWTDIKPFPYIGLSFVVFCIMWSDLALFYSNPSYCGLVLIHCVTELKLYTLDKLSSAIFCCLCVSEGSVSLAQISTFYHRQVI